MEQSCFGGVVKPPSTSAPKVWRVWSCLFALACAPKIMRSLLQAFPTRPESQTRPSGKAVNCVFRCASRRRAGMTRLPNIPGQAVRMHGGGDDWGVFISGNAKAKHGVTVNLNVPSGSAAGSDARAMVRALQAMRLVEVQRPRTRARNGRLKAEGTPPEESRKCVQPR